MHFISSSPYEEISMLVPVKVGIMFKLDLEKAISIYLFFNFLIFLIKFYLLG
jgi:hypothetical protein